MIVEAGLNLADAQAAADSTDRLFPLSLASQGSCHIGGILATNAGGVGVLAYGNARALTLGLEVVTADGDMGRPAHAEEGQHRLRPPRSFRRLGGYARRHHRGGAAALPATGGACRRARRVAGHRYVAALFRLAEARGHAGLTAFEFLSQFTLELVMRNMPNTRIPFASPPLVRPRSSCRAQSRAGSPRRRCNGCSPPRPSKTSSPTR